MQLGQGIDLETDQKPFAEIQFPEGKMHEAEAFLDEGGPDIMMQIDDIIKLFLSEFPDGISQIAPEYVDPVNVGIGPHNGVKGFFHQKMDLCMFHLLLQAPYHRGGQHNIPNGAHSDNKKPYGVSSRVIHNPNRSAVILSGF